MAIPAVGNPDRYQKKGVAGEAKRIVVKTKGIAKVAQIWARGMELRGKPGTSGVEQFEWNLITLVSLTRLFYHVNRYFVSILMTECEGSGAGQHQCGSCGAARRPQNSPIKLG